MSEVIPFRSRNERSQEETEIGLMTAVDAAIRDLGDIVQHWGEERSRIQAHECRRMLEQAFRMACGTHPCRRS
jgi:plasmid stabilization system protein ParE